MLHAEVVEASREIANEPQENVHSGRPNVFPGFPSRDGVVAEAQESPEFNSIGDFNVAVRLKQFLEGGADSRQEVHAGITLEDLQARHQRVREQLATMDDALAGVVPDDRDTRGNGSPAS